ncbi:Dicarboxylate transport [Porphyrobacter sp. LM 6]|nr:Dicarboxylate transport [Porphyrobacter sp. LM 6]
MPVADEQQMERPQDGGKRRFWPRRWRTRIATGAAVAALVAGSVTWMSRERIAGDVIDDYLDRNGVPATYDIVAIGPREQVIENLVVGDPARPDLTVRRMVVALGVGWAGPELRRVTVEGARAFGSYRGGRFSLGALDPLIFTDSAEPPALPAIDLIIRDGRALVESEFGAVGLALEGAGRLDDGFDGTLAATAPGVGVDSCRVERATLYGKLTTKDGAARLDGPLRIGNLACGTARLATAATGTELTLARDFSGADGAFRVGGQKLRFGETIAAKVAGSAGLTWRDEGLVLAHDLSLSDIAAPQGRIARIEAEGAWRGALTAERGQWDGQLRARGLAPADDLAASLVKAERGLEGTLLAPLLSQARGNFTRALTGADVTANGIIRHKGSEVALIIPEANVMSRGGQRVLALSQVSGSLGAAGITGLRGNVIAGGAGVPQINGRMEQEPGGAWALRLAMAEYSAGGNRMAIPRLSLRQLPGGGIRFDGVATASGEIPGGRVNNLAIPVEGAWSNARGLLAGTRCLPLSLSSLELGGLALRRQNITLCPEGNGAMVRYRDGLTLAARSGALRLVGTLGESPATIAADSLRLRYPAPFAVDGLTARIGAEGSEARLFAASLTGSFQDGLSGAFEGGTAQLDAVPLVLGDIAGRWSFAEGALQIGETAFVLSDRPAAGGAARFRPLAARGANLTLANNAITADAILRHPGSGRAVADVRIRHDLDGAVGQAHFSVPDLAFDEQLQPEDLSYLAKGVIAFADGAVTGSGQIDWRGDAVTSSGRFRSNGLDFAAAFGPVRGLAGEVVFTDLLNLTTAPDQIVRIAAINPGIEVTDGTVRFEVSEGRFLSLEDARFPFMGGTLDMRPLVMDFSQPEERHYVFEITGLDAATFVTQMELTNLSATGVFDGTVPIVFDKDGNGRIEGGLLLSRAGGGNVAYIGELTYEDLGTMGNYAFEALRSLDYRQMSVGLSGDLAGEIITNFDFDGVRQGAGTSQNFVTRRLAKLPIRFKVNVRSENFYELATMVRSFWDADYLGNPVDKGLLKAENGRFVPVRRNPPPDQSVQPPESESQP